jgi:hypothetical protein
MCALVSFVLTPLALADETTPLVLMEELFDLQTIRAAEHLFSYFEARLAHFTVVCAVILNHFDHHHLTSF